MLLLVGFPVAAPAQSLDYGPQGINIQPPAGFMDSESASPALFEQIRTESGLDGVLLKVYLPEATGQFYAEGRADAITRQLCLYGFRNNTKVSLDRKALDLMSKSYEGMYSNYEVIPAEVRRNRTVLQKDMRQAMKDGTPLLVTTFSTDTTSSFVSLITYSMGEERISQAVCTSLILIADTVVLATASSIIQDNDPAAHTAWVRNAAEVAADMLMTQNKVEK